MFVFSDLVISRDALLSVAELFAVMLGVSIVVSDMVDRIERFEKEGG
jgi:hypothetical protein